MTNKLFGYNNKNRDALVVPQQEGATEDDTYFGSIGDATAKHVSSLSHADRQLWQELLHMRSGSIFRLQPSPHSHDTDPFALRGKELDKELKTMKEKAGDLLDDSTLAAIKEAFEQETERREQSEDAYDRAELIPYHQMEQFPGMEKWIDIPQTPKDWFMYMGTTKQPFLDEFPEGHLDSNLIMRYIRMLDKADVDDSYYDWVRERLDSEFCPTPGVIHTLSNLIGEIEDDEGEPDEHVKTALLKIDNTARVEYINFAAEIAQKDYILQLLVHKGNEWEEDTKQGYNVYSSIKAFGRLLFENYRDQMKSHHWARYRKLRNKHAPQVIVRGKDINRCRLSDLMRALFLTHGEATKLWCARPFDNLGRLYNEGYIGRDSFASSPEMDTILAQVEKAAEEAGEELQLSILSNTAKKLVQYQLIQKGKSTELQQEWRMVWSFYRLTREEVTRKINNERKENARQEDELRLLEDLGDPGPSCQRGEEASSQGEACGQASTEAIGHSANDSDREARQVAQS